MNDISKGSVGVDPSSVMSLSTAYWGAQTLLTANRIGVFDALASGPLSVEAISAKLGVKPRPTRLLLKACVSLDLLEETAEGFSNSDTSKHLLVSGTQSYLGNAIRYSDDLYDTWGKLEQALKDDCQQLPAEEYLGLDEERTRHFVYGMHDRALGIGNAMASIVDLSGRKKMLDVGGGPGTYSSLFTRRYPELHSQVLDLPDVVAIASEIIEDMGASGNVSVLPGDYKKTTFPEGNDVVMISGVFHRETEEMCRNLIVRAKESLNPGGMLVVADVFTETDGNSPSFATLFGLNMMLTAPDGGVHADADVGSWMMDAGFDRTELQAFPPPMPHRIVCGYLK